MRDPNSKEKGRIGRGREKMGGKGAAFCA